MKPIAILTSLLALVSAQDAPTHQPPAVAQPPIDETVTHDVGDGPLATITRDRSALFVDLAKTKHTPVRTTKRDPFLFPAEQERGAATQSSSTRPSDSSAADPGSSGAELEGPTAPAEVADPLAGVIESVKALEINAVLVAKDGGSCLVRGDILRVGDTVFGGRATLTRVGREGVSFSIGERSVDVALLDRGARRATDESLPTTPAVSEDTGP